MDSKYSYTDEVEYNEAPKSGFRPLEPKEVEINVPFQKQIKKPSRQKIQYPIGIHKIPGESSVAFEKRQKIYASLGVIDPKLQSIQKVIITDAIFNKFMYNVEYSPDYESFLQKFQIEF